MILLDFSGTMFQSIAVDLKMNCGTKTDIGYLRHLILNSIRAYNKQFSSKYGELIICLDSKVPTWRKEIFPYYKAARKKARIDSGIDWKEIFSHIDIITNEIKEYLPYKVIGVDELEADDVIAILAKNADKLTEKDIFGDMKYKVLIVSNDKDYAQLHKIDYVKQYKPKSGTIVKEKNPDFALADLVLHGDESDGIPNILSDEDTFTILGKRQKSIKMDFIRTFLNEGVESLNEFSKARYEMNKKLISFDEIPSKYTQIVLDKYYNRNNNYNKFKLFQYFANNKLNNLIDRIDDFNTMECNKV